MARSARTPNAQKVTANVAPERRGAIALPAILLLLSCLLLICVGVWGYKLCG
jgi:hypothetical protein